VRKESLIQEIIGFLGHHKCGTTWLSGILEKISRQYSVNFGYFPASSCFGGNLSEYVSQNNIQIFAYVNADYDKVKDLRNYRGFHVIRDLRDVVISGYFSHLYSHGLSDLWPALTRHREELRKVDIDKGLMLEIDFAANNFKNMNQWNYSDLNILEIKMEDLLHDENEQFFRIFSFLGLFSEALTQNEIKDILATESFVKKTKGRKQGDEDPRHHYRKGIAGDWKNYFKDIHKDYFKSKYQFLLEKLDYEKNDEW
jgi:hypothetical protein